MAAVSRMTLSRKDNGRGRPSPGLLSSSQLAAVLGNDTLGNRQPQPGPARLRAVERLKHLPQLVGWNPRPAVADSRPACEPPSCSSPNLDAPPSFMRLHRVQEQVQEYLAQLVRVRAHLVLAFAGTT